MGGLGVSIIWKAVIQQDEGELSSTMLGDGGQDARTAGCNRQLRQPYEGSQDMNLVYGSFCPIHEGNSRCPCRTLTTNASIWTAAELGDVGRLRKVVTEKGRRPDSLDPHGYTPLHLAAQNGRLSAVRYLLEAGASPDGVPGAAGGCGATPLHRAAFAGQLPCVHALLAAGAQPQATDASFLDMKTPLHKAAGQGHRGVCIALLEARADPNASDAAGNSPLDLLDMSLPMPSASIPGPPGKSGDGHRDSGGVDGGIGSGKSDERDTACSVVVLSSGEDRDWGGVREALERYGGRRSRFDPVAPGSAGGGHDGVDTTTSGGHGGIGEGDSAHGSAGSARCCSGASDGVSGGAIIQDNVGASRSVIARSLSMEASSASVSGGRRADSTSAGPSGCKGGDPQAEGTSSASGTHATPQSAGKLETVAGESGRGGLVEEVPAVRRFSPAGGEGNASAGVPCGECRLPKVVMVRAACCGALLCKPCVRHLSARRRGCRKCSGDGGA